MLDGKWAAFWFRDYETVESSTGQNLVFVHTRGMQGSSFG